MAYIGQVLKNPETGWRRYDDSDALITYEGAWEIRGSSSAVYGKYHICGGKSKIQFSFVGSKLRIIGSNYKFWTGTVNVEIDGEKCGSYNIYDPNSLGENSVLLYEKNDLQYATHNVVLHADSTSTLDALDFGEPGGLVVPIKVGDVLKEPESGWKRFDDTDSNIRYTGVWANSTHSDFYNSTLHFKHSTSNNPPDKNPVSLKFNFIGTRLRVIGLMNSSYDANATILVDGVEEIISFFRPGSQSQTLVYEKIGLMNQEHTVEIKGYFINLDAIDIDADGELVPFKQEKTKVSLYEKESGKIFVDDFDSVNPKWLMSPSNEFNNAAKKGFLR
ncbi:hypothetical protein FC693_27560, partial [Bacillus cereus]